MFNYFKGFVSFLRGIHDNSEEELLDDESKIINAIRSLNLRTEKNTDSDIEEERPLGETDPVLIPVKKFKYVHKTGKVTHLSDEYGLIDNVIYFVPSQVSSSIHVRRNDEVLYTAYKAKDNESERVFKIYALKKDSFEGDAGSPVLDEKLIKAEGELNGIIRHIPGRVTKRKGRDMYIDTLDTWCNLDKIQTSFIPIEGDWVSVQTVVEFDEDVANFVGGVIEIISIKPLIKKSSFGRVTLWSLMKREGVIENSVFFTALECENGYSPSLGDQVVYDAIESDQDSLKWRALLVYPYEKNGTEERKKKYYVCSNVAYVSDTFIDNNGISISPFSCGVEVELNHQKIICFDITNNSAFCKLLKSISLISARNCHLCLINSSMKNFFVKPNQTIRVYLTCIGKFLGLTGETCLFRFEDFVISRKIEINVIPSKDMDNVMKCKLDDKFTKFRNEQRIQNEAKPDVVLFGPRLWQPPKFISRERRCVFTVPKKLQEIVYKNLGKGQNKAVEEYAPYLKFDLTFNHYADRFHTLLYLEELELLKNFRKYDMNDVFLTRNGEFFSLKVPGLVERRPSVIIGDSIILRQPWCEGNKIEHVGFIHEILREEVLIKFHGSFHYSYDGSKCNIRFVPNTFFFARCHEAVKRAEKLLGEKWLFPSSVKEKPPQIDFSLLNFVEDISNVQNESTPSECEEIDVFPTTNKATPKKGKKKIFFRWVNKDLNERQKLAVVNVLKAQGRPLPYIIFGPPGTGKTVTLVEIILQIYMLIPESRILVTTPSNSSADLICSRLIEMVDIQPGQLIRLTAITRILEGLVPPQLRSYTTFYRSSEYHSSKLRENEYFRLCSMNELTGKHRITVSTCSNIGRLHFSGFPTGHFTHILVDEAGQTVEPEVLIAATFQNIESGQVVLAGDPQQLGPVVCSRIAGYYGFGESLLQRFSKTFPYAKDIKSFPHTSGFDPRFMTRLNVNYRSVPEILSLPSQMFYNSDLIPTVSQTDSEEARIIEKFNFMGEGRDKPAAIIFHGIIGTNYQGAENPSWFNPHEIWQVVMYLKKLYSIGLKASDIGVVTPYSQQAYRLKDLTNSLNLAVPKIGTVEEHQGQENKVIILSTVRSSLKDLETDVTHHLGFVACPKRLNVSLTRARALLIIIGNPVLLSHDPYWVTVIKYCIENKSYTGCNLEYFEHNLELGLRQNVKEEEKEEQDEENEEEGEENEERDEENEEDGEENEEQDEEDEEEDEEDEEEDEENEAINEKVWIP